MSDRISERIAELTAEREKGRRALSELHADIAALEAERQRLKEQMLRIDGAIQILEELSEKAQDDG